MSKIAFIGDMHLDNRTPVSRLDNYEETSLRKLQTLINECIANQTYYIVTTSDFFNRNDISISYLNKVINILKEARNKHGIILYSVIGNHDLPYNNMKYFSSTPLHTLASLNLVYLLGNDFDVLFSGVHIYGMSYTEKGNWEPKNYDENCYNILVTHYALTNNFGEKDYLPIESLGNKFNLIVAGHDHTFFRAQVTKEEKPTIILRPGVFIRRTKIANEEITELTDGVFKKDNIVYYVVDTESNTVEPKLLGGVEPSELVFKASSIEAQDFKLDSYSMLDEVFENVEFTNKTSDELLDILLNNLDIEEDIKQRIKKHILDNR